MGYEASIQVTERSRRRRENTIKVFKKKPSGGKNYEYYLVHWSVAEESEQW